MEHKMRFLASMSVLAISLSGVANALELDTSVSVGVEHTNNSRLTSVNEEDDLISSVNVTSNVSENNGPLSLNANASLTEKRYAEDTFNETTIFSLGATANWAVDRERLNILVQDFFRQRKIDSINPAIPDNEEDTNVFSVAPRITLSLSKRTKLSVTPSFRDYYYEKSGLDNQQFSVDADWLYLLNRTMDLGVGGSVSETHYDNEVLNPNTTFKNLYGIVNGKRQNWDYTLNLGATEVDRDNSNDYDGMLGKFILSYYPSGKSTIRLHLSSNLTDTNRTLFDSSVDIATGDFDNEQSSSDVIRNKTFRLQYERKGDKLSSFAWAENRDLDYKLTLQDREVDEIGVRFDYKLDSLKSLGLFAVLTDTDEVDTLRRNKKHNYGASFNYKLARQLSAGMLLAYEESDGSGSLVDYDETSVSFNLVYAFDKF